MSDTRIKDRVLCNPSVKLEKGVSYSFIDMEAITPGIKAVGPVESSEYSGQSCSKFCNGDTLMARITPCLENGKITQYMGKTAKAFGSTEFFVFRGIPKITDNDYVYYLMSTPYIRKSAVNSMTGASGRQRADITFISKIKWDFPSYQEQKRIAEILSVYDNLIEINNKRINVLEQMAENLYKEWFVRFRFPGHESVPFENGLPKGWMLKRADEVITFNPNLSVKDQTQFTIIPMEALSTTSMVLDSTCFVLQDTISGRRSQNGDTLLAKITPCLENGKTGFVMGMPDGEVFGGSTEFVVMRSKALNPYYVYWLARSYYFRQTAILSMNGADGRQRVDEDKLKSMKIIQPSKTVLDWFERIIASVFDEINTLVNSNISLSKQRDLLLPRLMSGRMEVNLEEQVNE